MGTIRMNTMCIHFLLKVLEIQGEFLKPYSLPLQSLLVEERNSKQPHEYLPQIVINIMKEK